MLIKLTGNRSGRAVLIESSAIVSAEELEDAFQDNKPYTRLELRTAGACNAITIGVNETCDDILEKIEESEDPFYE